MDTLLQWALQEGNVVQLCLMCALVVFQQVYSKQSNKNDEEILSRLKTLEETDEETIKRVDRLESSVEKLEIAVEKLETLSENLTNQGGVNHAS